MINLPIEILAKCLVNGDDKTPIRNAVALRGVSTGYLKIVESEQFLLSLIRSIDPFHPYLSLKDRVWSSFKEGYFASSDAFSIRREKIALNSNYVYFSNKDGVLGVGRSNGIEVCALGKEPFCLSGLEGERIRKIVGAERSEKYFAIYFSSRGPIHVYTADGKDYLGSKEVTGGVRQMGLVDHLLYYVNADFEVFVVNMDAEERISVKLPMPALPQEPYQTPYLFFKNYLICLEHGVSPNSLQFLSLSNPKKWVQVDLGGVYFPFEDGVFVEKWNSVMEKITFLEATFIREPIGSLGKIDGCKAGSFNQRIFFENAKLNALYCYDALKNKTSTLQYEIPEGYFLRWSEAVADRVYALFKNQNKAELMTIQYSAMQYLSYHA